MSGRHFGGQDCDTARPHRFCLRGRHPRLEGRGAPQGGSRGRDAGGSCWSPHARYPRIASALAWRLPQDGTHRRAQLPLASRLLTGCAPILRMGTRAHLRRWNASAPIRWVPGCGVPEYAWTHLRWVPRGSRSAGYPSEGWVLWTFLSSLGKESSRNRLTESPSLISRRLPDSSS